MPRRAIMMLVILIGCMATGCSGDECSADVDCNDGDLCTEDECRLGVCAHPSIPWCCEIDHPCTETCRSACDMDSNRCHECRIDQDCTGLRDTLQTCEDIDCEPCRGKAVFWSEGDLRCHPETLACVECVQDTDCTDAALPRCHPVDSVCVACLQDTDCGPAHRCNPQVNACELVPITPGRSCTTDVDCESGWCLTEAVSGYPGGFCGAPCSSPQECASAMCIDVVGGKTCLPACANDDSCRPEYMCLPVDPGHAACFPKCSQASHCPATGTCNLWLGLCFADGPGLANGEPCTVDTDCKGYCAAEASTGLPGGLCVSGCSFGRAACPDDDFCAYLFNPFHGGRPLCQPAWDQVAGCRDQYVPLIAWDLTNQTINGACQPACRSGGCTAGACNPDTGLCGDPPREGGAAGEPCATHADCEGLCMDFWTEGYCTRPCDISSPACPGDEICMNLGIHTSCGAPCVTDQDCRNESGYLCHPALQACFMP